MKISSKLVFILINLFLTACQTGTPIPTATVSTSTPVTVKLVQASTTTVTPSQTAAPSETPAPTISPTVTDTPAVGGQPSAVSSTPTATTGPAQAVSRQPSVVESASGTLTIGVVGRLESLNPLLDLSSPLQLISPLLYYSLNRIDSITGQENPNLASLVQVSADGLRLTYTLNDPSLTPSDAQASIETAVWPELDAVRQVSLVDETTLAVEMTHPNCAVVDALARLPILPSAEVAADSPQGSGPFVLENWNQETNTLRLRANNANPNLYPQIETITVRLFENEAAALAALQAGEVDALPVVSRPAAIPPGYRLIPYPGPATTGVIFNNQDAYLRQPAVRQALSYAVDHRSVLRQAFGDDAAPANGILPQSHWAAVPISPPKYDPALAASLLDEAGFRDTDGDGWRELPDTGEPWEITIRADRDKRAEQTIGWLVAAAYRQLGIKARAESVPFFFLIDDLLSGEYQAAVYSLPVLEGLDQSFRWHSGQIETQYGANLAGYSNPQVDAWLEEANVVSACNSQARAELYQNIQTQINEDHPADFIAAPTWFVVARENIQGLAPGPFAPFTWNVAAWTVP